MEISVISGQWPWLIGMLIAGVCITLMLTSLRHTKIQLSAGAKKLAELEALLSTEKIANQNARDAHLRELREHSVLYEQKCASAASESKSELQRVKQDYEVKLAEKLASDLTVNVIPYVSSERQKNLLTSQTKIDIGYKYQLLIRGLPCFEPHIVITSSTFEKELDEERLMRYADRAVEAARQLIPSESSGAGGALFTLAEVVVTNATKRALK